MTNEDGMTEEVLAVVASKYSGQEDCLPFQHLDKRNFPTTNGIELLFLRRLLTHARYND